MIRFILKRLAQGLVSLFAMSLFIFLLVRLTGDPGKVLLPLDATPDQFAYLSQQLGLDKPLPEQYVIWIGKMLRGDFGESAARHVPVAQLLAERVPNTLALAGAGFSVTLFFGLTLGVYSAAKKGGKVDLIARVFGILGQSVPIFWLGLLLIMLFAVQLRLLPAGGKGDGLASFVLPAITIGWFTTAGLMRVTRSAMLEVLSSDYIKLARIKGVRPSAVLWTHALKNAALPVLTYAGLILFGLVTGSIITETVFAWPGLGTMVVAAVVNRDFNVVQVVVVLISAVYIMGNLAIDVLYAFLNPRIRFG